MEFGGNFLFQVKGKTGIRKGRETYMMYYARWFYPCTYTYCRKLQPKPLTYMQQVRIEVWNIIQKILPLVVGEVQSPGDKLRKIYKSNMHVTMDNNFSRDVFEDIFGTVSFGGTWTKQKGCFTCGVDTKYIHRTKQQGTFSQQYKASRYEKLIILTKISPPENRIIMGCKKVCVAFQSTRTTKIHCINALLNC